MGSAVRHRHLQEPTQRSASAPLVRLSIVAGVNSTALQGRSVGMRRADVLIEAMAACKVGVRQLARRMGVDKKEVERWRAGKDFEDHVAAMGSVGVEFQDRWAKESR